MKVSRSIENRRQLITDFLKSLRESIIASFESLEPSKKFERCPWNHHSGGGGEMGMLRGDVFEKAAVNWSAVEGSSFPTGEANGPFYATGVSLITHMLNPHAPTVHMNVRYIETQECFWFGGGYDLTPMGFTYPEDNEHFHAVAKESLDCFGSNLYQQFSQNAREYFYIPHRKKERGIGGIFFDHFNSGNYEADFAMWQNVGASFLKAIQPIYMRRIHHPYNDVDRLRQMELRAHYVEFNLLYDRGTKFGVLSGGNPDAYLASMPPCAKW